MIHFPPDTDVLRIAVPLIQKWESFRSKPYRDAGGIWTIGYGTTQYPDGRSVNQDDAEIDESFARIMLVSKACRLREQLERCVTRVPSFHQAAALISLAYNIGIGIRDGVKGDLADSTLLEKFNAGDIKAAADHFLDWVYIHKNGKPVKLDGLVNRRKDERSVFLTKD